jgi:hypothetical protein
VRTPSDKLLTELLIASGFVKLSSMPPENPDAAVSLASVGNCEIRMFLGWQADLVGLSLFWLELFDHVAGKSVDSFRCYRIKDAVPVFEEFVSQAARFNSPGPDDAESH